MTEKRKLKLRTDPRNARTHPPRNLEAVKRSLDELGAGRSIVVDRDGIAIGGSAVLEKAVELGLDIQLVHTKGDKLIVVVRDDLATDDPRRKALALADNQIALLAEWDLPLLKEIKLEIEDIDLDVMGFELPDEPIEEPTELGKLIDHAEELQKKWKVKRGQIFRIPSKATPRKSHRVMCGDSTDAGDVAALLDGAEPYLMVTDPPYGVEYDPAWRDGVVGEFGVGAREKGQVANDERASWGEVFKAWPCQVLYSWSPGGDHIVETGAAILYSGFQIRSQIIWSKQHFALSRGHYHWKHEPCWYAVRKGAKAKWCGDRTQSTVWAIASLNPAGRKEERFPHGTQKPVECMARPIRNHEGDVADPFLGSGTTVVAAEQEGRICYGMEICEKYVSVTLERLFVLGLEPRLEGR